MNAPGSVPAENNRLLILVVAGYFAGEALLRTLFGGPFVIDDGEMMLLARHLQLGYGPQPPLYYWLQHLVFQVVGRNILALAIMKDTLLFLAFLGMYYGGRQVWNRQGAAAAALSLALLPSIIWEFQRGGSHSIFMLTAVSWTVWAWFRVIRNDRTRDWLIFGLALGIGGLSKPNYWAVPLFLVPATYWLRAELPKISWSRLWMSLSVAVICVAPAYAWSLSHPGAMLASLPKFYYQAVDEHPRLIGFARYVGAVIAELLLPALVFLLIRWRCLGRRPLPGDWAARLLIVTGVLGLLVAAVLVPAFSVTRITARWLVPCLALIAAGTFAQLGQVLPPKGFRLIPAAAALFAVVSAAGMIGIRNSAAQRGIRAVDQAIPLISQLAPARIEASFVVGGYLSYRAPGLDVVPAGTSAAAADGPDDVLFLSAPGAAPATLPDGWTLRDEGVFDLADSGSGAVIRLPWRLAERLPQADTDPAAGDPPADEASP